MALNISDEDASYYQSIETSEKRKLFRLSLAVVNDLKGGFDPTAKVEDKPIEKPVATFKAATVTEEVVVQEEKPPVEILIEQEEIPEGVIDETPEVETVKEIQTQPKQDDLAMLEMANSEEGIDVKAEPVRTREVKQNDETFTSMLGVNTSVSFYQNLAFTDKKRVDRIMAIRLVNEKYTLNPGLSILDRDYFNTLPQNEKGAIERLKLYFRSWSKNKEFANLKDYDLQYLASIPQDKRDQVARIIVRRGIGVDDENYIQFGNTDWNKYKSFSESEVTMIKNVASLLKEHQQFFDVALAYAGDNYTFNNNLAYVTNTQPVASTFNTSDPELPTKGTKLTYESIYFDPGEYALRKEALIALNELLDIYQQNPEISFALEAYSYEKGNGPANIQLSTLRVNSAKTYLINKGVPDAKIQDRALSASLNSGSQHSMQSLENRKLDVSILNSPNVFQSEHTTYMVQPGNTLFSLSKANGTSIDELMALNGLDDTNLYAYQPLRVRKTATLNPDYMVETSQELVYNPKSEVAVKNLTSIEDVEDEILADESEIASTEEEEDLKDERGGTMMVIDVTESSAKPQRIHIVEKGEKLEDIARKYDTNVPAIMKNNNLKKPKVKKGQRLKII
jgi:LysM repeat protein